MKSFSQQMRFASALLVITLGIVSAFSDGKTTPLSAGMAALFVCVYFVGAWRGAKAHSQMDEKNRKGSHTGAPVVWIILLTILWAVQLWASKGAVWLAFPLIFLQVGVLGTGLGSAAAAVTCAITIILSLSRLDPGESSNAAVLGPLLGSSIALVLTWAVMAVVSESRSRKLALAELSATKRLLADSERGQVLSQERERIAREIHDTVSQGLSATAFLLQAAQRTEDPQMARTYTAQALTATEDSLLEARRVTQALAPRQLAAARLVSAVKSFLEEPVMKGLHVNLEVDNFNSDLDLGSEAALLRVIQSALANVKEHAKTSEAQVVMSQDATRTLVEIRDQGCGFQPETQDTPEQRQFGRGLGLPSMHQRMANVGGALTVHSGASGTTITATLPKVTQL